MIRLVSASCLYVLSVVLVLVGGMPSQAADNLLTNPGFEAPLAPHWEKRTPEDKTRTLRRVERTGRDGSAAAVLENLQSSYTRLRQGADRSIAIEPGQPHRTLCLRTR